MTAQDIRNALKPFADFAPAIIKAMEIVQAAEDAEKRLASMDKEIAARKAEMVEANRQLEIVLAKATAERTKLAHLQAENEQRREDLLKSLNPLKHQKAEAEKAIADAVSAKDKMIAAKNDELEAANEQLLKVRREIDRLKKQFAA
jgi:chromosome segregation ATPase